ncbi:hypothetical protein BJX68DRAFT_273408 [Aspergillus pseudodeflectus]|uniref:SnoaL-like domain-containing protein n=1 Tax=Aspergillus pseudodeflectus TaxID=176178 RepID=A0ABR4JA40_9EURO
MPTLPPYTVSETIRHNKSKYAHAADTKQWALFASVLHPSLTASLHNTDGSTNSFSSREEYVEFLDKAFADIASIHVVGAGELEMLHNEDKNGEDEVAATWAMSYQLGSAEGARGYTEIGGGHYHEVWKRLDGQWVIASLKFVNSFRKVL